MREVLEQYKALFQSLPNEQIANTPMASAIPSMPIQPNPVFSSMSNLSTLAPNPIFLSTSLPMETTITPSITKNPQDATAMTQTSISATQSLANYDITITPFCSINTTMPMNMPVASTVTTSNKPIANVNPTDTNIVQPYIYNANPVSSVAHAPPANYSMTMSNPTTQTKPTKGCGTKVGKQLNVANAPIVNPSLATFGSSDLYNQQMQMFMNLMQDGNTFQQLPQSQQPPPPPQQLKNFSMPTQQKPRTAAKRKPKQTMPINTISSNILPNTTAINTLQMPKPDTLSTPNVMLGENHPLYCPTMDVNSAALKQFAVSSIALTNPLPTLGATTQPTTFATTLSSPQAIASQPTTPTKTLQQKLAERKKANQQQSETLSSPKTNLHINSEVIILD